MTPDEQLILVLEKLLGWTIRFEDDVFKIEDPNGCRYFGTFKTKKDAARHSLPPLTLDLVHECWLKLTPDQRKDYFKHLSRISGHEVFYYCTLEDCVKFELATLEQRLAALVETIKDL